jgi:hypothetical protein
VSQFKFTLGQRAVLVISGEKGTVVGRAEYLDYPPAFQLEYVAADGRATSGWFTGRELDALEVLPPIKPPPERDYQGDVPHVAARAPYNKTTQQTSVARLLQWAVEDLADPAIRADSARLEQEHKVIFGRLAPHIDEVVQLAWRQLQADHGMSSDSKRSSP